MSKYLTLREVQLEELEILKKLSKFLDNNNIRYFLCCGTLLGAIRHKGFIPWDDDVDIFVPRSDYNRLMEICKKEKIDDLEILSIEHCNSCYPFAKVVNNNIEIESKANEDKRLWIDIFPIDGLPENDKQLKKHIGKIMFFKGMFYLHNSKINTIMAEKKSLLNRLIKVFLKPFATIIPLKIVGLKINKIVQKYNYDDCDYVGIAAWTDGIQDRFEKKLLNGFILSEFEDEKFKIPVGYNEYLTHVYGDYMKLPPVEKRVTHSIKAKKIEDNDI